MYCPKCGKQIPDVSEFCMYCGINLKSFIVEISPKVDISPKIEAKAEGMPLPKWRPKPLMEIDGIPVYEKLAESLGKFFCPRCQNYDSLGFKGKYSKIIDNTVHFCDYYYCYACGTSFLKLYDTKVIEDYLIYLSEGKKLPVFDDEIDVCPFCGTDLEKREDGVRYIPFVFHSSLSVFEYKISKFRGWSYYYRYPVYTVLECENDHLILVNRKITTEIEDKYISKYCNLISENLVCKVCYRGIGKYYCKNCKIHVCAECVKGWIGKSCPRCGNSVSDVLKEV